MDISDLRNLPVADKLKLVTELWDDISTSPKPISIPPAVIAEASRRSAELTSDTSLAIDSQELWRQVDG